MTNPLDIGDNADVRMGGRPLFVGQPWRRLRDEALVVVCGFAPLTVFDVTGTRRSIEAFALRRDYRPIARKLGELTWLAVDPKTWRVVGTRRAATASMPETSRLFADWTQQKASISLMFPASIERIRSLPETPERL